MRESCNRTILVAALVEKNGQQKQTAMYELRKLTWPV
jgi:hypothetical protein